MKQRKVAMIIDFHTHIFPDKIAGAAVSKLESSAGVKAYTDGTLEGLLTSMKKAGIDCSVILPVVTSPKQFRSIQAFAEKVSELDSIISFGGIHPDTENYREELRIIKNSGLKGIKLHPEYQATYIDDKKYLRIMDYASELGLIISVHAGLDGAFPQERHCTPERIAGVIRTVQPEKLVLAHMGGLELWDEVERYIVGSEVYLDTSFSIGIMKDEQLIRIARNHGIHKILFATDSPWGGQKEMADYFQNLSLTPEEKEMVLWKNAERLLGIQNEQAR